MSNDAVKTRYASEKYKAGYWACASFETLDQAIAYGNYSEASRVTDTFDKVVLYTRDWENVPIRFKPNFHLGEKVTQLA